MKIKVLRIALAMAAMLAGALYFLLPTSPSTYSRDGRSRDNLWVVSVRQWTPHPKSIDHATEVSSSTVLFPADPVMEGTESGRVPAVDLGPPLHVDEVEVVMPTSDDALVDIGPTLDADDFFGVPPKPSMTVPLEIGPALDAGDPRRCHRAGDEGTGGWAAADSATSDLGSLLVAGTSPSLGDQDVFDEPEKPLGELP